MIKLLEFEALPLDRKAQLTWLQGRFLMYQINPKADAKTDLPEQRSYAMSLYALADFYVEICYDTDKNQIVSLQAFKDTSRLTPYLDKITLR